MSIKKVPRVCSVLSAPAASGLLPAPRGGSLKEQWLHYALIACGHPPTFYTGARKIIRPLVLKFTSLDNTLSLSDAGYTGNKLTSLTKHYLHDESRDMAVALWNRRREQAKYGSVGFTTYNHFVKGGGIDAKRSKRASVFGPCIQSVVITWLDKEHYSIDIAYRTTELLKKFPADLVLIRDVLLKPFDFKRMRLHNLTFYFANATVHTMYAATIIPHLDDPIATFEHIKRKDNFWWQWAVKWTARYVCDEYHRGIAKFSQALRVQKDIKQRTSPRQLKKLQQYLRKNHPGYRNNTENQDDDDME